MQSWLVAVSIVLLFLKGVAYVVTGSVAIFTDALESTVNVVAGFIGLYSLWLAAKPRDQAHPYGHGKIEFVSAAIEGTLVLSAGVAVLYKGVMGFIHPKAIVAAYTGIGLIAATAVVNWAMGAWARRQGRRSRSLALEASGRHLQTDAYSTAALVGGLLLWYVTRWWWIDPLLAALFGCYILYTGYSILRASLAGIMDERDTGLLKDMTDMLNHTRRENWIDLHNLRVIKFGAVLHVDCHLTVPWYLTVQQAHGEVDQLSNAIRTQFGPALELFVHSDGCEYFQCSLCEKKACHVRQHPFISRLIWSIENVQDNRKHGEESEE